MKHIRKLLASFLAIAIFATPLMASAVTYPMGRAYSGDKTVSTTVQEDSVKSNITLLTGAGSASTTVASATGFAAGNYVLLIQMSGTGKGNYEVRKVSAIDGNRLSFYEPTTGAYQATNAQVIKINEYNNVTVTASGSWQASAWNGTTGGVLVALINGTFTQSSASASTTVAGKGFTGGSGAQSPGTPTSGNGSGGGEASGTSASGAGGCGGGGGSHAGTGGTGGTVGLCIGPPGDGGPTYGAATLATGNMELGSGGGGGFGIATTNSGGSGGTGGGIILLFGHNFTISAGLISAKGDAGGAGVDSGGGGGGASGGSIRVLPYRSLALGTGVVIATAGAGGGGGTSGGSGGTGRIATNASATVTGTSDPTIDTSSTDVVRPVDSVALDMNLGSSI